MVEPPSQQTPEEEQILDSKIENQEGYADDGYPLTVTDWEADLITELAKIREDWGPRQTRIAVGHPSVRARTANNPGLVRRAFLLAAADRRGTWSPKRLAADGCPLWSRALAAMDADAVGEIDRGQPDDWDPAAVVPAPRPARPIPAVKQGPTQEYLAARALLDGQRADVSA